MPHRNFIGGAWVDSGEKLPAIDPATETVFAHVATASPADVGQAAGAARKAVDEGVWPRASGDERVPFRPAFISRRIS